MLKPDLRSRVLKAKIIHFYKITYFIDLLPIIKANLDNGASLTLLASLIQYGFTIDKTCDVELQRKVLSHLARNNLYNLITSYKVVLFDMSKDADLYSHFNHFYLTKYPTSSGCSVIIEPSLQLQGFKLIKSISIFKKQKLLFADNVKVFMTICKEILPKTLKASLILMDFNLYLQQEFSFIDEGYSTFIIVVIRSLFTVVLCLPDITILRQYL